MQCMGCCNSDNNVVNVLCIITWQSWSSHTSAIMVWHTTHMHTHQRCEVASPIAPFRMDVEREADLAATYITLAPTIVTSRS
jgi:hypothetical protein